MPAMETKLGIRCWLDSKRLCRIRRRRRRCGKRFAPNWALFDPYDIALKSKDWWFIFQSGSLRGGGAVILAHSDDSRSVSWLGSPGRRRHSLRPQFSPQPKYATRYGPASEILFTCVSKSIFRPKREGHVLARLSQLPRLRRFMIGDILRHFKITAVLQVGRNAGPNVPFPSPELFALGASPKDRASFDFWSGPSTSARLGEAPTLICAPRAA